MAKKQRGKIAAKSCRGAPRARRRTPRSAPARLRVPIILGMIGKRTCLRHVLKSEKPDILLDAGFSMDRQNPRAKKGVYAIQFQKCSNQFYRFKYRLRKIPSSKS